MLVVATGKENRFNLYCFDRSIFLVLDLEQRKAVEIVFELIRKQLKLENSPVAQSLSRAWTCPLRLFMIGHQ